VVVNLLLLKIASNFFPPEVNIFYLPFQTISHCWCLAISTVKMFQGSAQYKHQTVGAYLQQSHFNELASKHNKPISLSRLHSFRNKLDFLRLVMSLQRAPG